MARKKVTNQFFEFNVSLHVGKVDFEEAIDSIIMMMLESEGLESHKTLKGLLEVNDGLTKSLTEADRSAMFDLVLPEPHLGETTTDADRFVRFHTDLQNRELGFGDYVVDHTMIKAILAVWEKNPKVVAIAEEGNRRMNMSREDVARERAQKSINDAALVLAKAGMSVLGVDGKPFKAAPLLKGSRTKR